MKTLALMTFGIAIVGASSAIADTPVSAKPAATTSTAVKVVKPMMMTCEDFLSYDEVTRPQIVSWSEGVNRKGKPDEATFDIERTTSLVPVMVQDCTKEPQTSFWKHMKQEMKKIF